VSLSVSLPKIAKTVTIDKELLDWIEEKIKEKEFASLCHAIEKALYELKEREQEEERPS
jgi:Arc/MetJ-type ribon-helix-helix transcriptional regulator